MRKNSIAILAALAFAVLTTACSQQADIGITTKVKSLLDSDRSVPNAAQIQVTTENKVVTLAGPVDSPATKERAVTVARGAEGVKKVVDNLTVAPGSVAEAQPAVAPVPVVESQPAVAPVPVAETQPAVAPVAKAQPAVAPVAKAQPAVAPVPVAKAQPAIAPVPVAETQPTVAPVAEAQPTVAPVPVAETQPAAVEAAPGTGTAPTDASITQAVKEKLLLQPETSSQNIVVDTHEGVVTLSGTVKSLQAKEQVILIARGTQGVQRVEDKLSVSSS
jgi:osmotically-inducible protein OsmY